jgi:PTS system ascorbate-specific IIA component
MSLADHLPEGSIITGAHASDWRDAVRIAGDALVATGVTEAAYTDAMLAAIEELGPYVVLAPGFALPHARPSEAVHRAGISWVSLAEPVEFGSADNDPVRLVVALAAPDAKAHVGIMAQLAGVLTEDEVLAALMAAQTPDEVRELLAGA